MKKRFQLYRESNHITRKRVGKIMVGKNEYLNMDISLLITYKSFKFSTCIHEIWMQGSVSQNFDLGPSFDFTKCRNLNIKKG